MFSNEKQLQSLIHEHPEVLTSGLFDIARQINGEEVPNLISLGREIPLQSGALDNLFIDANGILTVVECKLYSNSEIRREVYSQAVNYLADIQADLRSYHSTVGGESVAPSSNAVENEFTQEFEKLLLKNSNYSYVELVTELEKDPFLARHNLGEWARQFTLRLEQNIKGGIFRLVIACGPHVERDFHLRSIRNLMKLMQMAEHKNNLYDLSLVDVRDRAGGGDLGNCASRIVWRRYSELPDVPLIALDNRNTTQKVEEVKSRRENWPPKTRELEDGYINLLAREGIKSEENTHGLAFHHSPKGKKISLYTYAMVDERGFWIRRTQVEPRQEQYRWIEEGTLQKRFPGLDVEVERRPSNRTDTGHAYHIKLRPRDDTSSENISEAVRLVMWQDEESPE